VYALGLVLDEIARRRRCDSPLARLSLASSPGERPSAAMLAGWEGAVPVDAAYLLARLDEIDRAAREGRSPPAGRARGFVEGGVRALAALAGTKSVGAPLPPLDETGRRKLLVRIVGRAAENFRASAIDEETLLARATAASSLGDWVTPEIESVAAALARLA